MKILYISEDWAASTIHHKLLNTICELGKDSFEISLFCYYRESIHDIYSSYSKSFYNIYNEKNDSCSFFYKYSFRFKVRSKLNALENLLGKDEIREFDLIHATTLFSEGAIAYSLYRRYNIPYLVAVRATDINLYLKYMVHLWPLAKKIIENAKCIVFLSPSLKERFLKSFFYKSLSPLLPSISVIPNGLDDYYLQNISSYQPNMNKRDFKYLYIGRFDENKNVLMLVDTFKRLSLLYENSVLTLIGGGGELHERVLKEVDSASNIYYLGEIRDKAVLKSIFNDHDCFVMVSHSETFGLVYLEALSNRLPIIYTKNEGIDGFINDEFGIAVNSHSHTELLNSFVNIRTFDRIKDVSFLRQFSWISISKKYMILYDTILKMGVIE